MESIILFSNLLIDLALLNVSHDSTYCDIPFSVLLNAPGLLFVLGLLLSASWQSSSWSYARQRFAGLFRHVFSWDNRPRKLPRNG